MTGENPRLVGARRHPTSRKIRVSRLKHPSV